MIILGIGLKSQQEFLTYVTNELDCSLTELAELLHTPEEKVTSWASPPLDPKYLTMPDTCWVRLRELLKLKASGTETPKPRRAAIPA